MAWCPKSNEFDQDIFDALAEFLAQVLRCGDRLAADFGVPVFCVKALHRLDESVTLKELARRMHVDPSFVTVIADMLEERGLARREPNAADRRIKNLVLTPQGLALKARLEVALLEQMPWARALDLPEQESFLSMIRRMNAVLADTAEPGATGGNQRAVPAAGGGGTGTTERAKEVSDTLSAAELPGGPDLAAELTGNPA